MVKVSPFQSAEPNRHEGEDERALRERSSDPLGPSFALGGGFPIEQVATLKRMAELDFETLLPGHGGVLKGKAFVQQEIELIEAVIGAMNPEIGGPVLIRRRDSTRSRKAIRAKCGYECVAAEVRRR